MSTESLAARLGRILTKNPESDGLLEGQVEEFLSLYEQVPSSVKADKEQLETLLDRSKHIARQFDDYDMPQFTVNVQGFKFNPPNIQSELPCQLEFRVLPGTGKQIISVQDASSKPIATSGLLDPQLHNTFTTTICNPGSYAFTSEIYPFMAGQLITTGPAALADAASGDDAEQPVVARKPLARSGGSHQLAGNRPLSHFGSSNQLAGSKPLSNSNSSSQLTAKGQPHQQPDLQDVPQHPGRQDVGDADVSGGATVPPAARSFKCVSFEELPDQAFAGRVSHAAGALSNQPSETGMLELLSLPGDILQQEQQHPATQHISYQGELSRAGSYARRATLYDDELDGQSKGQASAQQGSSAIAQDAAGAADVPTGVQHVSYQGELSRAGPLSRRATKYGDELGRDIDAATAQHENSQAGVQELQQAPAATPQQPLQGHICYEGELCRAGRFARRATEYGDGSDLAGVQVSLASPDSSEANTHAGFTAEESILQHPQQTQQQHVSYQGELSRAGRFGRRATQYGDELDTPISLGSKPSDSSDGPVTAVAPPAVAVPSAPAVAAPVSNHSDSNMALQSVVMAAAAATSAAHGGGSVCSLARSKPLANQGGHRVSSHDGPVDMEVDEPQLQQQQVVDQQPHLNPAPVVSLIGFAKGLEGLEASLRFSPEPVTVASSAEGLVAGSVNPQASAEGLLAGSVDSHASASAADDSDGVASSEQQQQQQGELQSPAEVSSELDEFSEREWFDQVSDSSMGSIPCMYEPLASNSEQHSSASSQADSADLALRVSDDDRHVSSCFQGEGQNLLGDSTDRGSQPGPRRTWVDAAAAAMEDSGPGTWAQRRSMMSSDSNSPSSDGDQSESEDSADGDVRLRTVRQQHRQQQQQQDDVLQLEDIDDEDLVVDASATRTVGRAVQTELPPIRRPYRGLTAADAIANSAAARSGMLSTDLIRQEPPGGRWTLGSRASFAAGSGNSSLLRSTFTSTGSGPGPSGSGSGGSRWVVTGGLSSGAQHSSLQQATAAAAANAEQTFSGVNGSYFDRHVLGRNSSNSTATSINGTASLGPGKYVLSSKGSSSNNAACLDDPAARYAAITGDRQHSSQQQRPESPAAAAADSDEDPPELRVRTQRLLQQQAAAAAAGAAREDPQQQDTAQNPSTRASNSTAVPAPAAAATTKAAAASRKKKGRKAALSAAGAAGDGGRDKSAADARRREREEIEYALYQRGAGSRADSEDDTSSTHLRPSRLSSAAAAASSSPDEVGLSSTAEAARQLTKCRFKGCKLMFASDLNKHRCQMSHLPSARNTTTKPYKAEVLAFLRALPEAAVTQILLLPEPSQLPRRQVQLQQLIQQHSKTTKGISAAAAAAGSSIAAAIERLQGMSLSDAWIEQSTVSDSGAVRRQDDLLLVSELAQLCCGGRQRASSPSEEVEEAEQEAQQDGGAGTAAAAAAAGEADALAAPVESSAAAALAAAHAELLHGVCCSSCTAGTGHDAGRILDCSCSCHPAAVPHAGLLQHQQLDWIIALLDGASEGTFLVNPRLLQQPHTPSCCCSVCVGIVTSAGSSSSSGKSSGGAQRDGSAAVMESISCGLDILDIFGEWNVDDASLSYAVERRLVTAFHRAKDAEARRVMAQLLEDTQLGSSSSQQLAGAAAAKKKDKKKAAKAAKPGSKKVPAWKAVISDQYSSGGSDSEQVSKSTVQAVADSTAVAAAAGAWDLDELRYEDPSKGKQVAEQLLQVRLLQQDQELHQLRQQKQQAAKQQLQQQPIISTLQPPPPPHARPQSKQQEQQQQQVRRPQSVQRSAAPVMQAWRPAAGGATTAAGASGSSGNRDRSHSKPPPPQQQQQEEDSYLQPGSTWHTRTSSGGSGSGGGAGAAAAAGPSVLVVPRRRSSDVGSRRMEQPPPPPPAAATATEVGIQQRAVPTPVPAAAEGSLSTQKDQQQQYTAAALVGQSVGESADAASLAAEAHLALGSVRLAATESEDIAAGQQAMSTAVPAVPDQPATAAEDLTTPQDAYLQDHLRQQMQAQQQQQALLLQQHSMAFAQQQAYQHVFVASGRAAALAAGQEVPPFTSEEQQLLAEWSAYYYQQAYVAASQHMQLMQRHQVLQQQQVPGTAIAGQGGALQDVAAGSNAQQQQEESPVQLQFGSFPVDFSISSPDVSNSKSAQPTPSRNTAKGAPAEAETAATLQQQHMQPLGIMPEGNAVQHWYHQQYEDILQQQQQQQAVQPGHVWQIQQQQPEAAPTQHIEDKHWAQQQQSGVPGLSGAAFREAVVSALQAQSLSSNSSSSTSASALDAAVDHWQTHSAAPVHAALQFDARMASELLNDRWTAITAVHGLPQRQVRINTTVVPATAAAGDEASAAPAAAAAAADDPDVAEQQSGAPLVVSHSSRGSTSAARQRLDFTQVQQRGRRGSASGESRGRGRGSGSSSVWRAKQR